MPNPPLCANNDASIIPWRAKHEAPATRKVWIYFGEVQVGTKNDAVYLCESCASAIKTDAHRYGYRVRTREIVKLKRVRRKAKEV